MFKVLSQELRVILQQRFERHTTFEDFTGMDNPTSREGPYKMSCYKELIDSLTK